MVNYSEIVKEVDQVRPSEDGQELWLEEKELAVTVSELMEDTENSGRMEVDVSGERADFYLFEWSEELRVFRLLQGSNG